MTPMVRPLVGIGHRCAGGQPFGIFSFYLQMESLGQRHVDAGKASEDGIVSQDRLPRGKGQTRDVSGWRYLFFRIVEIGPDIQGDAPGDGGLKADPDTDVPQVLQAEFDRKGGAAPDSRDIVREVTEIIGPLDKSADAECRMDRIKAFYPQGAEKFPLLFKIILGRRRRRGCRAESIEKLQPR